MEVEDILKRALELEQTAIREYESMKRDADHETADLLDFLIEQEKEHVKMLSERLKAIKLLKE